MKAILQERYGGPDVLEVREIPRPEPLADQVLVKVHAASVNAGDWHRMGGRPVFARAMSGLRKPKMPGLGWDVAGRVEAVGKNVTAFRPGDAVFGQTIRTYAEYVRVSSEAVVHKPGNVSFEEAAAAPVGALTALQGLRDKGGMRAGDRVLIVGAGGGVGSYAVQIAKVLGADVTAVTRTPKVDMVRTLGPDRVIDRLREDFTKSGPYDVVYDAGGFDPVGRLKRLVAPSGTLVLAAAGDLSSVGLLGMLASVKIRQKLGQRVAFYITKRSKADLELVGEWLETGKIRSVLDRCYPLDQTGEAVAYVETGDARGKVVIKVV